jgi:hypothetical protein
VSNLMPTERIENRIFLIRGQKVMLDRDLAELYGVPVKRLNEQVKRNILRFPDDFMFQLTQDESEKLALYSEKSCSRSQFGFGLINSVDDVFHCKLAYVAIELTR